MAENSRQLDIDSFRARFDETSERSHWLSLHELADEDTFFAAVAEEFPHAKLDSNNRLASKQVFTDHF